MKTKSILNRCPSPRLCAALSLAAVLIVGCAGGSSPSHFQSNSQPAAPQTLAITTAALPSGTFGQFYQAQLQASGGVPPYRWLVLGGAGDADPLDSGLWLDP